MTVYDRISIGIHLLHHKALIRYVPRTASVLHLILHPLLIVGYDSVTGTYIRKTELVIGIGMEVGKNRQFPFRFISTEATHY